jgi:hypothetical protein
MKRLISGAIMLGIAILIYSIITPDGGGHRVIEQGVGAFVIACMMLYPACDALRSAWLGIQPTTSAP